MSTKSCATCHRYNFVSNDAFKVHQEFNTHVGSGDSMRTCSRCGDYSLTNIEAQAHIQVCVKKHSTVHKTSKTGAPVFSIDLTATNGNDTYLQTKVIKKTIITQKTYTCCDHLFLSQSNYNSHRRAIHSDFECDECDYSLQTLKGIQKHQILIHRYPRAQKTIIIRDRKIDSLERAISLLEDGISIDLTED